MAKGPEKSSTQTPQEQLKRVVDDALRVAATARRHGQSLNGVNFYANKMADLRSDATLAFGQLAQGSVGDTTALAELMAKVFSVDAGPKERTQAAREVQFALKTTWANVSVNYSHMEDAGVFPLVTLNQTKRGYLIAVGRQANGCYAAGWYDGCAVMMRRLLESAIIEAFEATNIDAKIKDPGTTWPSNLTSTSSRWRIVRRLRHFFTSPDCCERKSSSSNRKRLRAVAQRRAGAIVVEAD